MLTGASFEKFDILGKDLSISFLKSPLIKRRGVGTVSRALRDSFAKLSHEPVAKKSKRVYLFPFYGEWPNPLTLKNAVLIVHDLSLIKMVEFSLIAESHGRKIREACRTASHVVAISQTVKDELIWYFGIPEEKITVIHNPVADVLPEKPHDVELPETYLAFISATNRYKNLEPTLRALADISRRDYKLVACGSRDARDVQLCKDLDISDRVIFAGQRTRGEISYILSKSKGLIYPSEYEGFGLGPFEAALVGKPSVVYAKPAMTEVIRADEVIWAQDLTEKHLSGLMLRLYLGHGDPTMADRFAGRIRRELNPTIVANKYIDLFLK